MPRVQHLAWRPLVEQMALNGLRTEETAVAISQLVWGDCPDIKTRRKLTSLAVQVEKVEDTSTAALGDVVGDTGRARAVDAITLDDLSSRRGNGQRGEKSDEGGELHLERFFLWGTVNLIVAEACDDGRES